MLSANPEVQVFGLPVTPENKFATPGGVNPMISANSDQAFSPDVSVKPKSRYPTLEEEMNALPHLAPHALSEANQFDISTSNANYNPPPSPKGFGLFNYRRTPKDGPNSLSAKHKKSISAPVAALSVESKSSSRLTSKPSNSNSRLPRNTSVDNQQLHSTAEAAPLLNQPGSTEADKQQLILEWELWKQAGKVILSTHTLSKAACLDASTKWSNEFLNYLDWRKIFRKGVNTNPEDWWSVGREEYQQYQERHGAII